MAHTRLITCNLTSPIPKGPLLTYLNLRYPEVEETTLQNLPDTPELCEILEANYPAPEGLLPPLFPDSDLDSEDDLPDPTPTRENPAARRLSPSFQEWLDNQPSDWEESSDEESVSSGYHSPGPYTPASPLYASDTSEAYDHQYSVSDSDSDDTIILISDSDEDKENATSETSNTESSDVGEEPVNTVPNSDFDYYQEIYQNYVNSPQYEDSSDREVSFPDITFLNPEENKENIPPANT